ENQDLGLRVLIGKRQAIVSSTDLSPATLDILVERAIDMARVAPEDPWCGLADPAELASGALPDLDIFDPTEVTGDMLRERARAAEEAPLAVEGVTNSEGAGASWSASRFTLVTSTGFSGSYRTSSQGVSVSVLAGSGTNMERDYDFSSARHREDLESAELVGRRAAERAVRRLNPRKPRTARVPVVFDPRVSRSLIGHLAGAINGQSIARGTSFLKDRMGTAVFPARVTVTDDPLRRRGLSSRPFDSEGVATRPLDF